MFLMLKPHLLLANVFSGPRVPKKALLYAADKTRAAISLGRIAAVTARSNVVKTERLFVARI